MTIPSSPRQDHATPKPLGQPDYVLTINGQSIVVPGDFVLVRRSIFDEIGKAFGYIERQIDAHRPRPEVDADHGLIFARAEARDCVAAMSEASDYTAGTTEIHTARTLRPPTLDETKENDGRSR